ncbi:MAG: ECF transporter S component [Clostridia bacterium]|nr:ECF transporter S component [Clostridia bacterium]
MKKVFALYGFSSAKQLAFTAVFAALCCISTILITIPLPASGYFNTGDVFVLLSGWCLGPLYGSVAAAFGSALADIIVGASVYAPATFLIKGGNAFIAYLVWAFFKKCIKGKRTDPLCRILASTVGEAFMTLGYFLYEGLFLTTFIAAAPNILGNALQGICCLTCATLIVAIFSQMKTVNSLFPHLLSHHK